MGFLSSGNEFTFHYSIADCMQAMKAAINALPKFSLKSENTKAGTMRVNVSPGMTSFTWGDTVDIVFKQGDAATSISITSTSKNFSPLGSGQQSANVEKLLNEFTKQISAYTELAKVEKEVSANSESAEARLEKIKKLFDQKLITEEEYNQKRGEILASL